MALLQLELLQVEQRAPSPLGPSPHAYGCVCTGASGILVDRYDLVVSIIEGCCAATRDGSNSSLASALSEQLRRAQVLEYTGSSRGLKSRGLEFLDDLIFLNS